MTGIIISFAVGITAGAGAMAWHYHEMNKAVERVTARLERVTKEMHDLQRCADSAQGFRRGREQGMKTGAIERFGEAFEGRNVARMRITKTAE